jgi:glycosyltransferase involved in cell wall biosynthesis
MHVKNEADIIEENLTYYYEQGIRFVIIDDHSADNTFEICQSLLDEGKILELHRTRVQGQGLGFRNSALNAFQNPFLTSRSSRDNLMIKEAFERAKAYDPEWILVSDADAFLETRDGSRLSDGLARMNEKGFNTIEFFKLNFFPTRLDDSSVEGIRERLKHYVAIPAAPLDWSRHCASFQEEMYIGKHHVCFKGGHLNVSPQTWIYRHYPFRSYAHACSKLRESHQYQFGSRASEWANLISSEADFYRVSPRMVKRIEGQEWKLRYDLFEKDKLRSTKTHNAHEYLRRIWPTFPK